MCRNRRAVFFPPDCRAHPRNYPYPGEAYSDHSNACLRFCCLRNSSLMCKMSRRQKERHTRRRKQVAAVLPIKGIDAETLKLSTSPKFLAILRRSFRQLDERKTISLAEMKRRTG